MKRSFFFIAMAAVMLSFVSCTKDSNGCKMVPVDNEKAVIEGYAAANGITATRQSSGLFYQIVTPGSTNKPLATSSVFVKYTGTFLDGTVFDRQQNPGLTGFQLPTLIEGWKLGIPLVGKGGKVKLIVPSALAYGCSGQAGGNVAIPPNTPLYFEIELVDFL